MRAQFGVYLHIHKIYFKCSTRCCIIFIYKPISADSVPICLISYGLYLLTWRPSSQLVISYPYCIIEQDKSIECVYLYWTRLKLCISLHFRYLLLYFLSQISRNFIIVTDFMPSCLLVFLTKCASFDMKKGLKSKWPFEIYS